MDGSASVVEKRDSFAAVSPETVSDAGSPTSDVIESDLSSVADNDSGGRSAAVTADQALLSCAISCLGREVSVKTVDGRTYAGIFSGCKPTEFKVGLEYAYELPGTGEEPFVLCRETAQRKIAFDLKDVVCVMATVEEEKRGFATDSDYHSNRRDLDVDDFEEWEADPDIAEEDMRRMSKPNGTGGWSVDEMFKANTDLGVQSSFQEDLSQYTTVEAVGDEADRERARRIAEEIEGSGTSRHRALLENDDEERDLDKETAFDGDGEFQAVEQRRRGPNSKYAPRASGPPVVNGRSTYSRRDDTGSGGGAYGRNYAARGATGFSGPGHRYSNRPQGERSTGGSAEHTGPRPSGPGPRYGGPDAKPNAQYHDSGSRYNNNRYSGNVNSSSGSNEGDEQGSAAGVKTGTLGKRTGDLKKWGTKFNNEYSGPRGTPDSGSGHSTPREPSQPSAQPQQQQPPPPPTTSTNAPPTATATRSQTQNAWNRGPPTFESQETTSQPAKQHYANANQRPPQAQSYEPSARGATWVRKKESPRRDSDRSSASRKSSPTNVTADKRATPDSNVVQAQPTAAPQVEPSKPVVTQIQAPPQQPPQEEVKQQEVAPPATTSPSSSTITSGTTDKTSSDGRRFEFNPEAPAFVPKKDLTARCPSSTSTLSQTPVPVMGGVPVPVVPSMPPPTLVPQQPYVFNYHPQAQGVYAVPTMPVYGYPAAAQAMGRPQFPGHQHPAPPPGPSTSQQQQVASQQPSNAPTPSNSGQMGESPQAQPIYHPGPMVHSVSMPQQMQMAQQQPQPPQQMPPPMAPVPRPPQQYPGMAPNATIFVPGGPPQQYGQPMVQYAGANQFAPAYYQQPTGQVTTMHNAMPPPNSMQPVGVQTPQAAGVGGHPYQVFHQNPQQPTGAPIVTSSQPYTGGPQAYAGNAGMPQMNYVVPNIQGPAAVRYMAPQQQDYGQQPQYRS